MSNSTDAGVVKFYSTIAQRARRFGPENLVVFNPGTHTVNGGLFDQADIISVENNTNDSTAAKPSDFTSPPRLAPPAKGKIEPWRWLAVQGQPARLAAPSAQEALKRLGDFRKAGGLRRG